jgi:hypothetical protein
MDQQTTLSPLLLLLLLLLLCAIEPGAAGGWCSEPRRPQTGRASGPPPGWWSERLRGGGPKSTSDGISVEDLVRALRSASVDGGAGLQPTDGAPSVGDGASGVTTQTGQAPGHAHRERTGALVTTDEVARALKSCQSAQELAHSLASSSHHDTDLATQAGLEDAIKRANIQHNFEQALEHSPELYSAIKMLYVDCEVNRCAVQALVDTGAEATIMSWACAERCGVVRLVDERFSGVARGVGSSKIAGRIHVLPLKLGAVFVSTSVQVLAPPAGASRLAPPPALDFLLGLDSLRRFQCSLDLEANCLRLRVPAGLLAAVAVSDAPPAARADAAQVSQAATQAPTDLSAREPAGEDAWTILEVPFS